MHLLFLFLICATLHADLEYLPVSYKGRFRPLEVYSKLVVYDLANAEQVGGLSPLDFMRTLYLQGHKSLDELPLFYLPELGDRLSYADLKLAGESQLEAKMAFYERGGSLPMLPYRYKPTEWQELSKLTGENISLFSEAHWNKLQKLPPLSEEFAKSYFEGYQQLAHPLFPSLNQLKVETWYYRFPLTSYSVIGYLTALLLFLLGANLQRARPLAWISFGVAFSLHTVALLARSYILGRPPVSNMAETMIYVPWVASAVGAAFTIYARSLIPVTCATAMAAILLTLLEWTLGAYSLENVQAVLNSQLWLSIHVLMIVGSYGVLILAGFLGHIFLLSKKPSPVLADAILQALYIGVALLIPGTILGGVWAAQSWGRFWDWDPKESWAFISACTYLLVIHAYRFHKIGSKGLAIGSIVGLLAISFTWYGVNYILGTGLHSYGFGSGGEWLYFTFLAFELIFIAFSLGLKRVFKALDACCHLVCCKIPPLRVKK